MNLDELFKKISHTGGPSGTPEWIIAGLGNVGSSYENTRHNAGFLAVDRLADSLGAPVFKEKFHAMCATACIEGKKCLLMKPVTLMNNSGVAVSEAARFYKIPPSNIVIIFDDINLDVGDIRIKRKGSDGGHNGIKSIITQLNSSQFPRIKVGIGQKPHPDFDLARWVLSRFFESEQAALSQALENSVHAAKLIVSGKTDEAMNRFN